MCLIEDMHLYIRGHVHKYVTTPTKYLARSHIGWCVLHVKNDHKMASVPSSDHDDSFFLLESVIGGHHRMALELVHPMCLEDL